MTTGEVSSAKAVLQSMAARDRQVIMLNHVSYTLEQVDRSPRAWTERASWTAHRASLKSWALDTAEGLW